MKFYTVMMLAIAVAAAPAFAQRASEDDDAEEAEAPPPPRAPRPPRTVRSLPRRPLLAPEAPPAPPPESPTRSHRRHPASDIEVDVGDVGPGEVEVDVGDLGQLGEHLGKLGERLGRRLGPLAMLGNTAGADDDEDDDGDRAATAEERQREREERDRLREERQRERDERRREKEERRRQHEEARRQREEGRRQRDDARRDGADRNDRGDNWNWNWSWNGDRDGDESKPAAAPGEGRVAVSGKIVFTARSQSGNVEVVAGQPGQVKATLSGSPDNTVALRVRGDRVEPEFGRRGQLRRGKLRVEVPPGSAVDLQSMSGDVAVVGVGGEARVRTLSGDVKVTACAAADVQSISGEVALQGVRGPVRVQTVSGNTAVVSTNDEPPQLSFASTSGNLEWAGVCAKGCRLATETVSGDVKLQVGRSSSFALSFSSHGGQLDRGDLELAVKREPKKRGWGGGLTEATLGGGEGVIESDAFSGDLHLASK